MLYIVIIVVVCTLIWCVYDKWKYNKSKLEGDKNIGIQNDSCQL